MATVGTYRAETAIAGGTFAKNTLVKLSGNQVVACDTEGEKVFGLALEAATTVGQAVPVALVGRVKAPAGSAITAGEELAVSANGEIVSKAGTASPTTAVTVGVALDDAATGDVVTFELYQTGWIG